MLSRYRCFPVPLRKPERLFNLLPSIVDRYSETYGPTDFEYRLLAALIGPNRSSLAIERVGWPLRGRACGYAATPVEQGSHPRPHFVVIHAGRMRHGLGQGVGSTGRNFPTASVRVSGVGSVLPGPFLAKSRKLRYVVKRLQRVVSRRRDYPRFKARIGSKAATWDPIRKSAFRELAPFSIRILAAPRLRISGGELCQLRHVSLFFSLLAGRSHNGYCQNRSEQTSRRFPDISVHRHCSVDWPLFVVRLPINSTNIGASCLLCVRRIYEWGKRRRQMVSDLFLFLERKINLTPFL